MINWIFDLLKNLLGHWLLKEEEAEERKKDQERARKQKEIVESDYDTTQTADDLDSGKF
jgi:hypothetical protein